MKILCLGDLVGKPGRKAVAELLAGVKQEFDIGLTVINAENAAGGSGITPRIANDLFQLGCDVITLGDHVWDRAEVVEYLKENNRVVRPANFPPETPGRGWTIVTTGSGIQVAVIVLLGRIFVRYNTDCPFRTLKKILEEVRPITRNIIVDIHAEATSEKIAFGLYADGQVSAVFGTHTHVQTADEKVLPQGTAYITDLGMTGPHDSVIGQNKEQILRRFLYAIPSRFEVAQGDVQLNGVIIDIDEQTGMARDIMRIRRALPE